MADLLENAAYFVEDNVLPRLPPIFTFAYNRLPSFNTLTYLISFIYRLTSHIPYLPVLVALLAVYVAFFTLYNTVRSAFRIGTGLAKYATLLTVAYSGWNWLQGQMNPDANVGTRARTARGSGQDFWANLASGNVGQATQGGGVSQFLADMFKPVGQTSSSTRSSVDSARREKAKKKLAEREARTRAQRGREARHQDTAHAAKSNIEKAAGWIFEQATGQQQEPGDVVDSVWEQLKKAAGGL